MPPWLVSSKPQRVCPAQAKSACRAQGDSLEPPAGPADRAWGRLADLNGQRTLKTTLSDQSERSRPLVAPMNSYLPVRTT